MRIGFVLLSLLMVTACGGATTTATPIGSPRPPKTAVRHHDPAVLGMQLAAAQPGWPGPRMPAAPPRRPIDCKHLKCVALTFDDGPGEYTGIVLDNLAEHHASATFFLVGQMITKETEGYVRRMVSEGHELGNHSWDHPDLTTLSPGALRHQLVRTQEIVERVSGVRMRVMRPPYGATDKRVTAETRRIGLAQILWSVDTFDWRDHKPALVAERSGRARPGGIVLMHDIHKTTVEALPRLLDRLDRKGYTYVTVSELFGNLTPGRRYFDR